MKPARVWDERPLPGNRQRQKERVEARVVKTFTDVSPRRQDEPLLVGRDR